MKKAAQVSRGRPFKFRATRQQLRYLPGYALLLLCLALPYRNAFYFNNGSGGEGWSIGKSEVTFWTANNSRSLPELRAFALRLINRDRQLNGLLPLVEDPLLSQAAQLHVEDMKTRNYYAHITPEGKNPTDRLAAIRGQGGVGENIMFQFGSVGVRSLLNFGLVENFQKSWMYSTGHRTNLLNPQYTKIGYGIVADPLTGKIYAAQEFQ